MNISVQGIMIDRVSGLSETLMTKEEAPASNMISKWAPKDPNSAYPGMKNQTKMAAFLHTVVADTIEEGSFWSPYYSRVRSRRGGRAAWDFEQNQLADGFGELSLASMDDVIETCYHRCMATTNHGYMALVTSHTEVGDRLFVLNGGSLVYILRPLEDGKYSLVGECYLHGFMDEEAYMDGNAQVIRISIV
jgi:hypothetical protein